MVPLLLAFVRANFECNRERTNIIHKAASDNFTLYTEVYRCTSITVRTKIGPTNIIYTIYTLWL